MLIFQEFSTWVEAGVRGTVSDPKNMVELTSI